MRQQFSFGCFYGEIYWDLNFFPSKVNPIFDFFAFLNGGIRFESDGYWFLCDQGLLHFAWLTNNLGAYQAKWRLERFGFHRQRQECTIDGWF